MNKMYKYKQIHLLLTVVYIAHAKSKDNVTLPYLNIYTVKNVNSPGIRTHVV